MSTPTPVLLNKPATAAAAAVPVPALAANCMDSFVSALRAMPLDTILPSETLVATTGMRVPEVLQRLSTADILAMPVVDDATGECVGTVGMSELVEFATLIVPQPNTWAYEMDSKDIEMERWTTATVRDVLAAVTRRDDYALETLPPATTTATKAADGKDAATQTTTTASSTGLSVWQVFELMAEKHLRRLCIVTPATAGATAKAGAANRVRGFVTQSMLIRVCRELLTGAATAKTFGDAAARVPIGSILAVQWHSGHVITAHIHDPVITSFLRIIRSGIQGLAVVDDAGDIKSVLSIRDLRGVLRPQTAADKDTDPTSPSAATSAAASATYATTATGATPGLPAASSAAQRITAPGSAYGVRLWQLWCTTERFCERFAKPHSVNALKEPVFGTQFLTPASSLERALIMFADDSVHRCFVLRNEPHTTCSPATSGTTTTTAAHATASTKPLSVISQTDCLAYVLWLAKHYTAPAQLGTPQRYVYSAKPVVTSAPPTTSTTTTTSGSAAK